MCFVVSHRLSRHHCLERDDGIAQSIPITNVKLSKILPPLLFELTIFFRRWRLSSADGWVRCCCCCCWCCWSSTSTFTSSFSSRSSSPELSFNCSILTKWWATGDESRLFGRCSASSVCSSWCRVPSMSSSFWLQFKSVIVWCVSSFWLFSVNIRVSTSMVSLPFLSPVLHTPGLICNKSKRSCKCSTSAAGTHVCPE